MGGTFKLQDEDMLHQFQDTFGGIFNSTSKPGHKRSRAEENTTETETLEKLQKAMSLLTALTLRHESQLQAAVEWTSSSCSSR